MQKIIYTSLCFMTILCHMCFSCTTNLVGDGSEEENGVEYVVALAGNAFVVPQNSATIHNEGLQKWESEQTVTSVYLQTSNAGELSVKIRAKTAGTSEVKVTINGTSAHVTLDGGEYQDVDAGKFAVEKGYVKIDLQGVSKSGAYFAEVSDLIVGGSAVKDGALYSNEKDYYYWARRGPSCHLAYSVPTDKDVSYYYSELTVPAGEDNIGSYYMANGFAEGYFGIQVNSPTERRVLFSVWSPYETDSPEEIPEDERIVLNKKGERVYTGEFGNEGSGGQSYLRYNWEAGTTYRFLLKGEPDGTGKTDYTAWFYAPEEGEWRLIASFKRPKTDTYLKRFHSFLENFAPSNGFMGRKADYSNQWVRTAGGEWLKVEGAKFTVDATYRASQRIDATGGVTENGYYLQNGGFFNDGIEPDTLLKFDNTGIAPDIDFEKLP